MALADLSRDAVLAAMQEFDVLGRGGFLRAYGYRRARGYVVVHGGKLYDSKAIAGVAHQHVLGEPLESGRFTGGEKSVGVRLGILRFTVAEGQITSCDSSRCWEAARWKITRGHKDGSRWTDLYCDAHATGFRFHLDTYPYSEGELPIVVERYVQPLLEDAGEDDDGWQTAVGSFLNRDERMNLYGGAKYGGIEPSGRTPNVFVYSDTSKGKDFGYNFDGWDEAEEIFFYTGEGKIGHQQMTDGNLALLRHKEQGRALRLFVAEGFMAGTAAKNHRYLGEFEVDDEHPYFGEEAPDENGEQRSVFVFRLRPVAKSFKRRADRSQSLEPASEARAKLVDPEISNTPAYRTPGTAPGTAKRREADLCARFEVCLGRTLKRWQITPPGESTPLITDLYDQEAHELYEAKGTATRDAIRRGIGQLFDYRRHISPPGLKLAMLFPKRPSDDLVALLNELDITCVYELAIGQFVREISGKSQPLTSQGPL